MPATTAMDRIDRAEVLAWLTRQKALRALPPEALEALLAHARPQVLKARERLFCAGDEGQAIYLVLSGWLKLSRSSEAGRDLVLEIAGPGTLTGELAVLCRMPRASDATAISACRVLAIEGRALIAALRESPDALLEVIRLLGRRLANTTAQLEDSFLAAEQRLARALLRLAALDPQARGGGLVIDLGLSQGELGEITGLTRESINKLLAAWRDQGCLKLSGRTLVIIDLPCLKALADLE